MLKIPKKGAVSNNWRGYTLLSMPSKILAKIILKRMSDAVLGKNIQSSGHNKDVPQFKTS